MFFKKNKKVEIDSSNLPNHVAFICDGNRRWASSRGLPKLLGHKEGAEAIKRIIKRAAEINLKNITFFGFSTENFNRSDEEKTYLFNIFREFSKLSDGIINRGYKFVHVGDKSLLPIDLAEKLTSLENETKNGDKGTVRVALAYGGRHDIVCAAKKIIEQNIDPKDITEESFKKFLSTADMPDVDLLVRTSGEQRISGFLLYNMAYAELYFVKKHWPDFKGADLDNCILEYQSRHRRFGK